MEFAAYRMNQEDSIMTDFIETDADSFYSDDTQFEEKSGGGWKIIVQNEPHTILPESSSIKATQGPFKKRASYFSPTDFLWKWKER